MEVIVSDWDRVLRKAIEVRASMNLDDESTPDQVVQARRLLVDDVVPRLKAVGLAVTTKEGDAAVIYITAPSYEQGHRPIAGKCFTIDYPGTVFHTSPPRSTSQDHAHFAVYETDPARRHNLTGDGGDAHRLLLDWNLFEGGWLGAWRDEEGRFEEAGVTLVRAILELWG